MSALAGLCNLDGSPADPAHLSRMLEALSPVRAEPESLWSSGPVGLALRLTPSTPEDRWELQPLVSEDGSLTLVSDCRIDNRPELRAELGVPALSDTLRPAEAVTGPGGERPLVPDSRYVLQAYEEWGEECPRHLVGCYAFAVWDARRRALFAAASAGECRSLVYHFAPPRFAFATLPRGLTCLPWVPRRLNQERMVDMLVMAGLDRAATPFEGIRRLLGGTCLTLDERGLRLRRWWSPSQVPRVRLSSDQEAVEALRGLLDRAVADRLRASSPVAVMMSGGWDSSAVASTAARILAPRGERLATFTEVPRPGLAGPLMPGRYADETPFVRAVARDHPNLDLNLIRTGGASILEDLGQVIAWLERPPRNPLNQVWMDAILREAAHRGHGVMLTGQMGNMTISFSGQGMIRHWLLTGRWRLAWREAACLKRRGTSKGILRTLLWHLLSPYLLSRRQARGAAAVLGPPELLGSPVNRATYDDVRLRRRARAAGRPLGSAGSASLLSVRESSLSSVTGDASAYSRLRFGIDLADPTADQRVVEFCLGLPEDLFLRQGETRWLGRRALQDRLPIEVLDNPLRGLQAADWFERLTPLREELRQELDTLDRLPEAQRLLDLPSLCRILDGWPGEAQPTAACRGALGGALPYAIAVGRFLQTFERGAEEAPSSPRTPAR